MGMVQSSFYTAEVIVTNLDIIAPINCATGRAFDFETFTLTEVGTQNRSRESARFRVSVEQADWILTKRYPGTSSYANGPDDRSGVQLISMDIEDMLFFFRLFDVGEIAFSSVVITKPNGEILVQLPHRIVNGSCAFREPLMQLSADDLHEFADYCKVMKDSQGWNADWFQTARRFFLYGTSKDFDPQRLEVDRIVDYATVLEAILVPEKDLLGKRLRERCGALLIDHNAADLKQLLTDFYDIRSKIVHGEALSAKSLAWLEDKRENIESVVRSVLTRSLDFPPERSAWASTVRNLFEPSDKDREQSVLQDLMKLTDIGVLRFLAEKIEKHAHALEKEAVCELPSAGTGFSAMEPPPAEDN